MDGAMARIVGVPALALLTSLAACVDTPSYEFPDLAPVASTDYATTARDTSVFVDLLANDYDTDGGSLRVTWVRASGHSATVSGRGAYITPAQGFVGVIDGSYGVSDGIRESTGRISVTVGDGGGWLPDGGAPDAQPWPDGQSNVTPTAISFTAPQIPLNGRASIRLQGTDPDSTELTYQIVTRPQYGTVTGSGTADVVYQAPSGFFGYDWFEYTVSDGVTTSAPGTVGIYVSSVTTLPEPLSSAVHLREDEPATFRLQATDTGSFSHGFEVTAAPRSGTVTISGNEATYTPAANYAGTDAFSFRVRDSGRVSQMIATVTLTIDRVEDAPVGNSQTVRLAEDGSAAITLTGSDAEGDAITFEIGTGPAHGTVTGTPPALTYTPATNYAGSDQFTFVAIAGGLRSQPAAVRLDVTPVNDPPIAIATRVTTPEDVTIAIPVSATDIDTTPLTYTIVTPPTVGAASITGSTVSYTPGYNRSGDDQLTFEVFDGLNRSRAVVDIQVTPVNDPPFAIHDIAVTPPAQRLVVPVVGNDRDVDSTFEVTETTAAAHGAVELTDDGEVAYTPVAGFTGNDSFTYTITDTDGAASTGTVYVGVGQFPTHVPAHRIGAIIGALTPNRAVSLSADGRVVVFTTTVRYVLTDTNTLRDVYLYDRVTGEMTRVSATSTGGDPDAEAISPRISANGSRIVFESAATNLVAGDGNGVSDVFVYDRADGSVRLVSVDSDERPSNGASTEATISDDGNTVAFLSRAFNLVPGDGNGEADVFVRDLTATTTQRVSVSHESREAELGSTSPVISGDGRVVAFISTATNLVAGGTTGQQVFVRHMVDRTTECVSINTAGALANRAVQSPSLSHDGRFVAFASSSTNLAAEATTILSRAYVRDRQARHTRLGAPADIDALSTSLSADGRYLLVTRSNNTTYLRDRFTPTSFPIAAGSAITPTLSADGRYLVYMDSTRSILVLPNPL